MRAHSQSTWLVRRRCSFRCRASPSYAERLPGEPISTLSYSGGLEPLGPQSKSSAATWWGIAARCLSGGRSDTLVSVIGWDRNGFLPLFVLAAIPNPFFDLVGIAAGSLGYSIKRFLLFVLAGETVKFVAIVYACRIGVDWIVGSRVTQQPPHRATAVAMAGGAA